MTGYELFRRRIAPVLFLGMVGLIAYDSCDAQERTHATIVIDLGEAEARVRGIRADLIVGGETIATFERHAPADLSIGCPCRFETAMPEENGKLELAIDIDGKRRMITKPIHVVEGSTVNLLLDRELR